MSLKSKINHFKKEFFIKIESVKFQLYSVEIDPSSLSGVNFSFQLKYTSHSLKNHENREKFTIKSGEFIMENHMKKS